MQHLLVFLQANAVVPLPRKGSKTKLSRIYINPYFYTSNGLVQLEEETKLLVEVDDSILLKEFSKREKKKYGKTKKGVK